MSGHCPIGIKNEDVVSYYHTLAIAHGISFDLQNGIRRKGLY